MVDALIFQQTQAITEHNRHLIVQNTEILISKLSRGSAPSSTQIAGARLTRYFTAIVTNGFIFPTCSAKKYCSSFTTIQVHRPTSPCRTLLLRILLRHPQTCRHRCDYQSISPTGQVAYSECFQCLDCVAIYQDDKRCLPLIQEKRRSVIPIVGGVV